MALAHSVHEDVRWLDAPGLDADVASEDDRHAFETVWLHADIRLFVHAAKEGELDARERALLAELLADDKRTARQTLFVLAQADQLADNGELDRVRALTNAIDEAFPGCLREYLAEYDVAHDKAHLELNENVRFEDIVIETSSADSCAREVIRADYQRLHGALKQALVACVRQLAQEVTVQARASINQLLDQAARLDDVLIASKERLWALKDEMRSYAA